MRRRNKKHYSIYIAWILLLLCVIGGLKAGIEESAVGKEQTHSEISIQSRWEELLKSVSEKKNDKKKDQKKSESTEAAQKNIRILLMTDGYKQIVHKELKVSATGGLIIEKTGTREETAENEKITITKEDVGFQNGKIRVTAKDGGEMVVSSIRRGYGNPSYAGILDLYATSEGLLMNFRWKVIYAKLFPVKCRHPIRKKP